MLRRRLLGCCAPVYPQKEAMLAVHTSSGISEYDNDMNTWSGADYCEHKVFCMEGFHSSMRSYFQLDYKAV